MYKKIAILTLTLALTSCVAIIASIRPISSPQLQWVGARSQSLGGLNPTLFGDTSASLVNPAAMGSKDVMPISISSQKLAGDFDYLLINSAIDLEVPIAVQGRLKQNFSLGLSYASAMTSNIPQTYFQDNGTIRENGSFSGGFDMLYLSGATDFFDIFGFNILSVGTGIKYMRQILGNNTRGGFGIDAGAIASYYFPDGIIERAHVGASIHNILSTGLVWDVTDPSTGEHVDDEGYLPYYIIVGGRVDLFDDQLSVFANNTVDGALAVGGEYWVAKYLALRGSSNFKTFSLGTGLVLDNIGGGISEKNYGLRFDISYTQNAAPIDLNPNINFTVSILGESKPKTPQIITPLKEVITREKSIGISGIGPRNTTIQIFNNQSLIRTLTSDRYGSWQFPQFKLNEGKNKIYASAYSIDQQTASYSDPIFITSDSSPPSLNIKLYPDGKNIVINVESNEDIAIITGNIGAIQLNFEKSASTWTAQTPIPPELKNNSVFPSEFKTAFISAKDKAGNSSKPEKHDFFVAIDFPQDKTVHYKDEIRFIGKISKHLRGIQINGTSIYVDSENHFANAVKLKSGKNLVKVLAKSKAGDDLTYTARILRLVTFPDLTKQIKERREIEFLATLGVLDGDNDGNFYPDKPVTRRYIAKTIVKLKKFAVDRNATSIFPDVANSDPDAGYIQAALENGLMFAYPDGNFKPDQALTLSEALFLLNNAGIVEETQTTSDNQYVKRKELAQYLAYTAKYETQIEKLIDWEKGYTK